MRIAFLGTRGVPARYSGFETFIEQLGVRLAARGHEVTVYNRAHFAKLSEYRGMRVVTLPAVRTKHLETISHTLLSSLHALREKYDIAYYCIVGNSPLVFLPRITGSKTLINVDGADWQREKWGKTAAAYQRWTERIAPRSADVIIADSRVIQRRYQQEQGVDTVFAPYGGNIVTDENADELTRWGLERRRYLLYVGRLVPENAIHLLIEAFRKVKTDMKLVIVGDTEYTTEYREQLHEMADPRVVFTGYAFGDAYKQLSRNCYLYVQPSAIEGTRPALLDQLGFGSAILSRDSGANSELLADYAVYFEGARSDEDLAAKLSALVADPRTVAALRQRAPERISGFYDWDRITSFYEDIFRRLISGEPLYSYGDPPPV